MLKKWVIGKIFKIVLGAIALGIGIWYLSSSIGGASLSYTSVDTLMQQIGAGQHASDVPGCFLCGYLSDLFNVLGRATESFWTGIVKNLWIVMIVGFGIFIIFHTLQILRDQATSKDIKDLTDAEPKLDFAKWFDKVWKTGLRVLLAGALIGVLNWTGTASLRAITNVTVTPVMFLGAELSRGATGVIKGSQCNITVTPQSEEDILMPVLNPFMCVMSNLNTVMLAGAGGGFALMNYAWISDLGGGVFTWIAGLALVIMFLVIGFDLLFQVLTVIFKLIFVIIFMPLLLAAAAFEQVWGLAKGLLNSSISMLVNSAVAIIKISLKICILYAIVYFSADNYYPGPSDGFTSILPPLLSEVSTENMDAQTMSVMAVFSKCEQVALVDGKIEKDKFVTCFDAERAIVEQKYPDAFKFMSNGFDFLMFMIGIAFLYFWILSPKIDEMLAKDGKEPFDYGQWMKDLGKNAYNAPYKAYSKVKELIDKGK